MSSSRGRRLNLSRTPERTWGGWGGLRWGGEGRGDAEIGGAKIARHHLLSSSTRDPGGSLRHFSQVGLSQQAQTSAITLGISAIFLV